MVPWASKMYVWGTANPRAVGESVGSGGAFFSLDDIREATGHMAGKDVLCEHSGSRVGHVVSAWEYDGSLHCIFLLDGTVNGNIAKRHVKEGKCSELSLGYTMNVHMSKGGDARLRCGSKEVRELSIVVKGARDNCYIHGYTE
jgi:hypothetical protein